MNCSHIGCISGPIYMESYLPYVPITNRWYGSPFQEERGFMLYSSLTSPSYIALGMTMETQTVSPEFVLCLDLSELGRSVAYRPDLRHWRVNRLIVANPMDADLIPISYYIDSREDWVALMHDNFSDMSRNELMAPSLKDLQSKETLQQC